jgi:formylmethanofuran dehydrogenase subunit E
MLAEELLEAYEVALTVSLQNIIGMPNVRVGCDQCGEDILNGRSIRQGDSTLCRACSDGAYYSIHCQPVPVVIPKTHAGISINKNSI